MNPVCFSPAKFAFGSQEPLRSGGQKRQAQDQTVDASSSSSSSLQALNPSVGEQEASFSHKRPKAQAAAPGTPVKGERLPRLPDSKQACPGRDELFARIQAAVAVPNAKLDEVRGHAQALIKATDGDLAVDPDLRRWAVDKLIAAAKELRSVATVRLAEVVGELFGGREIGGECGAALVLSLLDPKNALSEGQLQAIANGLARAKVIDDWASPPVALSRLYIRLSCDLVPAEQVPNLKHLAALFNRRPSPEPLFQALGQQANAVSVRQLAFLIQGIGQGLAGASGCDQLADGIAAILRTHQLADDRIDRIMLAALNPIGEKAPGARRTERAERMLARLLAQSQPAHFYPCRRVFQHLYLELLKAGATDPAAKDHIARLASATRDGMAGPATFALGITAGGQPALRRKFLQALASTQLATSAGTPAGRTEQLVLNVVAGMSLQLHVQTKGASPAERRIQLDALMGDVLQHLADAPLSHWKPSMGGLVQGLKAREIAESELDWAVGRMLQAASTATPAQLALLAEGLGRAVGGATVSSERRQRIELALDKPSVALTAEQGEALRSGLDLAWKAER